MMKYYIYIVSILLKGLEGPITPTVSHHASDSVEMHGDVMTWKYLLHYWPFVGR